MAFQDTIASLMARPGQDAVPKDDVPWWLKVSGRAVGTFAGFFGIIIGIWTSTGILFADVSQLLAGVWLIVAGFILLCVEAPCCCMFIDQVQRVSDMVDNKPYYMRAVGYFVLAIPPVLISFGLRTFFSGGAILATGVLYGMMALGRKASADQMRAAAAAEVSAPANQRSNLVANAAPISFTGAPTFDSNV